jgi:hypothetical protein
MEAARGGGGHVIQETPKTKGSCLKKEAAAEGLRSAGRRIGSKGERRRRRGSGAIGTDPRLAGPGLSGRSGAGGAHS